MALPHRPRRRFGQHFLEDAWVRKVVEAAKPNPADRFIEIGSGPGALTRALAPRVDRLVAIELDRDLAASLRGACPSNVEVVEGDVLQKDLGAMARGLAAAGRPVRLIGNLPYNISSPILFRALAAVAAESPIADATFMLQREVADRLVAPVGSAEYGVLGILVRVHADVSRVLELPPGAFRPPPKVRSAVVQLRFRAPIVDRALIPRLERVVRGVFQQRRKTVANALRGAFPELDAAGIAEAVASAGVEARRRPQTLEMTELTRLAERLPVETSRAML